MKKRSRHLSKSTRAKKSAPATLKGGLKKKSARFGLVVARFNAFFTAKMLESAVRTLLAAGVRDKNIDVYHVPGSLEIPVVVKKLCSKKKHDALITLGVVIRGQTRHFNHVVDAAAIGTVRASVDSGIPVIQGVVAAENMQQAADRTGGKHGDKGRDAACAAVEMTNLMRRLG